MIIVYCEKCGARMGLLEQPSGRDRGAEASETLCEGCARVTPRKNSSSSITPALQMAPNPPSSCMNLAVSDSADSAALQKDLPQALTPARSRVRNPPCVTPALRAPADSPLLPAVPSLRLAVLGAAVTLFFLILLLCVCYISLGPSTARGRAVAETAKEGNPRIAPEETVAKQAKAGDMTALELAQARKQDELQQELVRQRQKGLKAQEDSLQAAAAKLEAEKREVNAEKEKLAERARRDAEAEARRKAEQERKALDEASKKDAGTNHSPISNDGPLPVSAVVSGAKQENALRLFNTVCKETAPLLAANNFTAALELLKRKAKASALADAAELLKQEQADIGALVELRKAALEALRKQVGRQVTLKNGNDVIKGTLVAEAKPDLVTVNVDGAELSLRAEQLHADDIAENAPSTGNVSEDMRRRGLLYFHAGQMARAKECFRIAGVLAAPRGADLPVAGDQDGLAPRTTGVQPAGEGALALQSYLDRIATLESGDLEAVALSAWERAEQLFAARNPKGAQAAYDAFVKEHGQTKVAAAKAAALKERCAAIDQALGPAQQLTLDLGGGVKMELVLVKAGEFEMGSNDCGGSEKPIHTVRLNKPYYIGMYSVTVAQFRAFAEATNCRTDAEKEKKGRTLKDGKWQEFAGIHWRDPGFKQDDNHPVVVVTWYDAQEFCKWATKVTGRTVRLPTEAEWEYAARGPQSSKYPWGTQWEDLMANVVDASLRRENFSMRGMIKEDDGYPFTSPGGAYKNASWCGAFDMAGNVWQWCQDYFNDKYYGESPVANPTGSTTGVDRVLRGGGWCTVPTVSARRHCRNPGFREADYGFRVVVESGSSRAPDAHRK